MTGPSIVLVGDCIATGESLLWPEISGDKEFVGNAIESLKDKTLEKKLAAWYVRQNKEKIDFANIIHHSYKTKIKKEKEMSWVSHIPECLNFAVSGETFQGMHKKIKKQIAEVGKPSMVLITCFSPSHRCVVINHNNQRHVVKRDMYLLEHDQHLWPTEVYKLFTNRVKHQELLGEQFQKRKTKKSFKLLIKLLDQHRIPHKFLLFRKYNKYLSDQYVDLTDLPETYINNDGHENLSRKLEAQPQIARRVMDAVGLK